MVCLNHSRKPYLILLFTFVLLEILLCGGIVFGWASIMVVFKAKHFYFDKCKISFENNSFSLTEVPPLNSTTTIYSGNATLDCSKQNDRLNLVFTVTTSLFCIVQLPIGIFVDKYGPRVARMVGGPIYIFGCMGLAFIKNGNEEYLFPTFIGIGFGGVILSMTDFQISNRVLWRMRAIVMSCVSGGFDSSAVVLLIFKLIYDTGVELSSIMYFYSGLSSLLIAFGTIFLIPSEKDLKKWCKEEETEGAEHFNSKNMVLSNDGMFTSNINSAFERSTLDAITHPYSSLHDLNHIEEEGISPPPTEIAEAPKTEASRMSTSKIHEDQASVLQSIFSTLYIIELACLMGLNLKLWCYVGSLQVALERLTLNDSIKVSKYVNIFGYIQLSGIIITPFIGLTFRRLKEIDKQHLKKEEIYVYNLRSSIAPYCITNILGMTLCAFDLIDSIQLQIPSFILCTVVRGFLYANHATYMGIAFPSSQFATLLGLSQLFSGLFGFLQYAFFHLTSHTFGGNSFWSNLILLILVSFSNAYPLYVWWICRKKEAAFRKSPLTTAQQQS